MSIHGLETRPGIVMDGAAAEHIREAVPVIASYGDAVGIREKAQQQLRVKNAIEIASQVGLPDWVDVDTKKMTGTLKSLPDREDILPDINENLVVELYSK